MSSTDSSLFATGIYGVVKTAAIIIFLVFVADTLGRRRSLIWTSGGQFILMFIIGIYGRIQPPVKGAPVSFSRTSHRKVKMEWISFELFHPPQRV